MALQLLKLPNRTIISRRFGRATSSFSFLFSEPNLQKLPFLSSNRKVCVDGKVVNKAGTPVSDKALAQKIAEVPKYVCRAGYKLEAAIEQLGIDVSGRVALDSGLSTGGFTDCLLQYGRAAMVSVMKEEATLVTLVKPQTEARRSQVGSGGVASDPLVHQEVLDRIIKVVENFGLSSKGRIESPLEGCWEQYRISRSLLRQLREVRMKKC